MLYIAVSHFPGYHCYAFGSAGFFVWRIMKTNPNPKTRICLKRRNILDRASYIVKREKL